MTPDEARELVEKIRRAMNDDEVAHALEDELYERVLRHIFSMSTNKEAKVLAGIALETKMLEFARWCA